MSTRTSVPAWAQGDPEPTEKQLAFIKVLQEERAMNEAAAKRLAEWLKKQGKTPYTKASASQVIEYLYALPKKDRAAKGTTFLGVPSGRYAVDSEDHELRFYRVWRGTQNPNIVKLYVLHGPDESEISHGSAVSSIMQKIAADVEGAALRYGREIGRCSNCGRRLTNRISRELAIGPVCGGRMFGDEFGERVSGARATILARGEDPDENIA